VRPEAVRGDIYTLREAYSFGKVFGTYSDHGTLQASIRWRLTNTIKRSTLCTESSMRASADNGVVLAVEVLARVGLQLQRLLDAHIQSFSIEALLHAKLLVMETC